VAPAHFPPPVYDFANNPLTKEGFELGRKIFYDTRLSRDGTISCGTCHAQPHAFADHGTAVSLGVENRPGLRNAPPTVNLAWMPHFMWDGGINHIEVMPLAPFTDPLEMDMTMPEIMEFVKNDPGYKAMFRKAFGTSEINSQKLLHALAQFQGSIVSYRSKYDQYLLGKAVLSANETKGLALFNAHCASCHSGVLLTDFSFRNNGLDTAFADEGRARITLNPSDLGKFKVPSLRNVALTNPYMHDGRFATLAQVLDHYSEGIQQSPTLDPLLAAGIPLSDDEKNALLAFLNTLTDWELLRELRFSEP
jgi:cytochrome c peroxidase